MKIKIVCGLKMAASTSNKENVEEIEMEVYETDEQEEGL